MGSRLLGMNATEFVHLRRDLLASSVPLVVFGAVIFTLAVLALRKQID